MPFSPFMSPAVRRMTCAHIRALPLFVSSFTEGASVCECLNSITFHQSGQGTFLYLSRFKKRHSHCPDPACSIYETVPFLSIFQLKNCIPHIRTALLPNAKTFCIIITSHICRGIRISLPGTAHIRGETRLWDGWRKSFITTRIIPWCAIFCLTLQS